MAVQRAEDLPTAEDHFGDDTASTLSSADAAIAGEIVASFDNFYCTSLRKLVSFFGPPHIMGLQHMNMPEMIVCGD